DENLPRMGERYRLRPDFDTTGFSPHARAILKGLQKYGMFMADNGGDWRVSGGAGSRNKGRHERRQGEGQGFEGDAARGAGARADGRGAGGGRGGLGAGRLAGPFPTPGEGFPCLARSSLP